MGKGQQLPRTPPLTDVKRHLDFCNGDPNEDLEAGARGQDDNQNGTFVLKTPERETEHIPDDPKSMVKGMKGYQLTPSHLEFIKKMKEEKLLKELQRDLEEVQRLLKKEVTAAELVCASRDKAMAELKKFPSCEELIEWVKVVLKRSLPLTKLTDLDAKSLLAMVTEENLQRAMDERRIELARMKKTLANKRKKGAEERGQLDKQMASEQLKVQGLMRQISDLKSELIQQEEAYKALEMQINSQEAPDVKVEEADTSEELRATKSQVKRRGKDRKKAVGSTEKLLDTTNQRESTRSKHTDSQTTAKDDRANKNTSETLTKPESGAAAERPTKSIKAAKRPRRKVEEQHPNPGESVSAVRGRRKPPGTTQTAASHPKNQIKVKTGEAQSTSQQKAAVAAGLRRSKRIASRR